MGVEFYVDIFNDVLIRKTRFHEQQLVKKKYVK